MASSLVVTHLAYGASGKAKITALYDTATYKSTYKDWQKIYGYSGSPAPYKGHGGVDARGYSTSEIAGAKIYSIFAGKVTKIYNNPNNTYYGGSGSNEGTGVKIDSSLMVEGKASSVSVIYCHMRSKYDVGCDGETAGIKVSEGQYVSSGTFLGYQGNTGNSSGEHLHISVYLNGVRVDPYPFITGEYSGLGVASESSGGSSLSLVTDNSSLSSQNYEYYTFNGSESLSEVAEDKNASIPAIQRMNNMDESVVDSVLDEGSTLVVPKIGNGGNTEDTGDYYEVAPYTTAEESMDSNSYNYNPTSNFTSYFKLLHFSKVNNNSIGGKKFWIPCTPDDVSERIDAEYNHISFIGRSSPYVVYSNTNARSVSFSFYIHRDMVPNNPEYIDTVINALTSALYPLYKVSSGTVIPPSIEFVMGDTVRLIGVLTSVDKTWGWPIINNKHMSCQISVQMTAIHENLISANDVFNKGSLIT